MNDREKRRYDMFGRVKTFGLDHASEFTAGGEALKRFAQLSQIIKQLETARAS